MKTLMYATMIAVLALFLSTPSYAQDDVPSCCRKGLQQEQAAEKDCCQTKSESKQFKSSCCAMDTTPEPGTAAQKGSGSHQGAGKGRQGGERAGKGRQGGGGAHGVMQSAHTLVFNYQSLHREVTEIPGGVRTTSITTDPSLVNLLRTHPKEMDQHLANGGHVRNWDPLFVELAKHHDKVKMVFRNIENGIEVTSTSDDPDVVKLIRAHAYKVSEFVKRGRAAMHESTPLPESYGKTTQH